MVEKPEYLALVNPVPAVPEAAQRDMLAKFEPAEWFTVDRDGPYDSFIRLVRPPRVVVVAYIALLGEQQSSKDARVDSMVAMKVAIHKHASHVVEVATGLRTDKDWRKMRPVGKKMCARFAQGRKSALNAKRGAKPWNPTPVGKALCREEWFGKRNATIDDAVTAIRKRWNKKAHGDKPPGRTVLYREFGSPYTETKR